MFTKVDGFTISTYTAFVFTGLDDTVGSENEKTDVEKCSEVCLATPHCRSFWFASSPRSCEIGFVNRETVKLLDPSNCQNWDGTTACGAFVASSSYAYYERNFARPTVTFTSGDSSPAFTDQCTVVNGVDTYATISGTSFTMTATFDQIVQNYRRTDGTNIACGVDPGTLDGYMGGWGLAGSVDCEFSSTQLQTRATLDGHVMTLGTLNDASIGNAGYLKVYTGTASSLNVDGDYGVYLPKDSVNSNAGRRNVDSPVWYMSKDTTAPTATITFANSDGLVFTDENPILVNVIWSEPVGGFDSTTDATVTIRDTWGAVSTPTTITQSFVYYGNVSESYGNWNCSEVLTRNASYQVLPLSATGDHISTKIPASAVIDRNNLGNTASNTINIVYDRVLGVPSVTLSSMDAGQYGVVSASPYTVTATFSEPVHGFSIDDIVNETYTGYLPQSVTAMASSDWYGTGTVGVLTVASGATLTLDTTYYFAGFDYQNINIAGKVSIIGCQPLVIRSTGTVDVSGTIDARGGTGGDGGPLQGGGGGAGGGV
eukprot:gene10842-12827_t